MNFIVKSACFAVAGMIAFAAMPAGDADAVSKFFDGRKIRSLFPGTFEARVGGVLPLIIRASGSGALKGKLLIAGKSDRGRWQVRSDKLCISWRKWMDGRTTCGYVHRAGSWYVSTPEGKPHIYFRRAR